MRLLERRVWIVRRQNHARSDGMDGPMRGKSEHRGLAGCIRQRHLPLAFGVQGLEPWCLWAVGLGIGQSEFRGAGNRRYAPRTTGSGLGGRYAWLATTGLAGQFRQTTTRRDATKGQREGQCSAKRPESHAFFITGERLGVHGYRPVAMTDCFLKGGPARKNGPDHPAWNGVIPSVPDSSS